MSMKTRVVVAMSGGVDSSVAAALLQKQGYEVIGITMCFGLKEAASRKPSCCGLEGIEDARSVAHKIGIRHYVLNFDKVLQDEVIKDFLNEYLAGRTPNPCIRCNQYLKFGRLLRKANELGAKYLATGHYAKVEFDRKEGTFSLKKARDRLKDQSYFLYRLNQKQLSRILMPLGGIFKEKVRQLASRLGLPVAYKPGSQEICFIPDGDYRKFLKSNVSLKNDIRPGPILDTQGNIIGRHKGIPFYTIGQREGLGIARGFPIYIVRIDPESNTIITGRKEQAMFDGLIARDSSFISDSIKKPVVLKVKIRYNHKEVTSRILPISRSRLKVIFSRPQFAVTPGQAAVFYARQGVVGGGIIESSLKND